MSLARSLRTIAELRGEDMNRLGQLLAVDMVNTVVNRTPVDQGDLRGSWQPTLNAPARGDVQQIDKEGSATKAAALAVISQLDNGVFYFVSNKPYARVAEYGGWGTGPYATTRTTRDGYSIQAPYGMVRITISEFDIKFRRAVRELRNQQRAVRG